MIKWICVFLFFLASSASAQKADFIKLEKLYSPEVSDGKYTAWKQESILIPVRFISSSPVPVTLQVSIPGLTPRVEWFELHSVWGDFSAGSCGQTKAEGTFEKVLIPDRARVVLNSNLESDSTVKWGVLKVYVPRSAEAKSYDLDLNFLQNGTTTSLKGKIGVVDRIASEINDVSFEVDFWQFPISVADYYGVKPWTEEHWKRIEEMLASLQAINQKSLTISIFWDLYNVKLRPLDEMMIQICRKEDGNYFYDFSNLEKYILKGEQMGVADRISIHNLFPWNQNYYFFDERSKEIKAVNAVPNSEAYRKFFEPLIKATSEFLERKNWKSKTYWVIDERDASQTLILKNWINQIAPGFKFSFAGRLSPALAKQIEEYALPVNVSLNEEQFASRIGLNGRTFLYTSCFEKSNQPNSLMTSDLRDIYFLSHLANVRGYQGILHWAYNLWSKQIKTSAIYSDVPSGDAHLIYPDGELSIRYLVFQDAIEEIGKFQLISKIKNSSSIRQGMNRYFLINIEKERFQMVKAVNTYLND